MGMATVKASGVSINFSGEVEVHIQGLVISISEGLLYIHPAGLEDWDPLDISAAVEPHECDESLLCFLNLDTLASKAESLERPNEETGLMSWQDPKDWEPL